MTPHDGPKASHRCLSARIGHCRSGARDDPSPAGPRSVVYQHHPHPGHGRRATGPLRPSGRADGAGAGGLLSLAALPALRPRPPDLAQSRPLRAVGRPRLDAALRHAASDWRQSGQSQVRGAGRAVGVAGRHQALSPARQQMPRPSGIPLDLGRRDDHRPTGARRGHQRRHGHRRAVGGQLFRPPGLRHVRLRRLRPVRRRLHDGGHLQRGRLAGRTPQTRQPVLDLRQQPHHHRGQHRVDV